MNENQRRHERVNSLNLLYLCVKKNGEVVQQGMGKTLNVSESGIRLETTFPIASKETLWITLGIEDDVVDLKGKIMHSVAKDNQYEYGIEFIDIDDSSRVILTEYIKVFKKENAAPA